jgi:hypothetical protein
MEFIIIHSAAFMGTMMFSSDPIKIRVRNVVGIGLFYSLFVLGFCLGFDKWWPMGAFWLLVFNRLMSGIFSGNVNEERKQIIQGMWGMSALCYVLGLLFTVLVPLPEFGYTTDIVFSLNLTGEGGWIEEPHRAIAFGCIYFFAIAYFEYVSPSFASGMMVKNR